MSEPDLEARIDKFVFRVPKAYWYTRNGVWVHRQTDRCRVGLGDYLQQKSGDVAFVELPKVGSQVQAGDVIATVETMKTSFDLESPLAGTVTQVNAELVDRPERINEDPYGSGWLLDIECTDLPTDLLDAPTYFELMSKEAAQEAAKLGK